MRFFWVIAIIFLSSCATVDTTYKGSDAGFALISLELDYEKGFFADQYYDHASFSFRKKGLEEKENIGLNSIIKYRFKSDRDAGFYEADNLIGQVALVPLEPGDYLISAYSVGRDGGGRYMREGVNIPFTINKNQITYLGNYHSVATLERRLLGLAKVKVGAYFIVADNHEKDLSLAKLLNPNVNIADYNLGIPELETTLSPRLVKERTTKFDDK